MSIKARYRHDFAAVDECTFDTIDEAKELVEREVELARILDMGRCVGSVWIDGIPVLRLETGKDWQEVFPASN